MDNRQNLESGIATIFLSFFILALLFDTRQLTPCIWIDAKDFEGQMNTVLQVQASVTTLGIALISLLSGYTKEMYFGISVSQYIMQKKPLIFTHKNNIFLELALIVLGYIAIVFGYYNTLVVCFIFGMGIIGLMVSDIFTVFSGAKNIRDAIGRYCLGFFKESNGQQKADYIFNALFDDVCYAIETNNNTRLKNDLNMYNDIFQTIVNREKLVLPCPEIIRWEDAYVGTCTMLYKQGNGDISLLAIESTCQILSTNAENKANFAFNIWDKIGPDFFNEIQSINQISLEKSGTLYKLHRALYMNLWFEGNTLKNNLSIVQYSSNVYYFLKRKKNTEDEEFSLIKSRLMDSLNILIRFTIKDDENKKRVAYKELGYYAKAMIDKLEYNILNKAFAEWFAHKNWGPGETKHNLIILIYLYYLSLKEELATEKLKNFATEITKSNRTIFQHFFLWLHDRPTFMTREYVEEICNVLESWEVFQLGKAKWVMMDYVVQEFILFNLLAGEYGISVLIEKLRELSRDMEFSYYSRFAGSKKADTQKMYEKFLEMFDLKEVVREKPTETMEKFESALTSIYKASESDKVNIPSSSNGEVEKTIELFKEEIIHELNGKIEPFKKNKADKPIPFDQAILRFETFTERCLDAESLEFMKESINSNFIGCLARMIYQKSTVEKVKADDKNMLDTFFRLVESSNIEFNTLIGYRNWFHGFARQEDFALFEGKMKKIRDEATNDIVFAIDDRLLYVNHVKVEITVDMLTPKEILDSAEQREGKYFYTVTNDIKLPYDKDELIEHVSKLRRIIRVRLRCEYGYSADSDKIGVGIEIEY